MEETEKQTPKVTGIITILTEAQERLLSLLNKVKNGNVCEAADFTEAKNIVALLNSIGERYPSPYPSPAAKVEGKISAGLTEVYQRALSLANQVKGADKLEAKHFTELKNIANLIGSLTERYPSPKAKEGASSDAAPDVAAKIDDLATRLEGVTKKLDDLTAASTDTHETAWPMDMNAGREGDASVSWGKKK